jgi:hypothetical protein
MAHLAVSLRCGMTVALGAIASASPDRTPFMPPFDPIGHLHDRSSRLFCQLTSPNSGKLDRMLASHWYGQQVLSNATSTPRDTTREGKS